MQDLAGQSPTAALMAGHDWNATPLGSPDEWPESLRVAMRLCLTSDFPIMVAWGPQLVMLYNEGYRNLIGEKHPAAVGQTVREAFPEVWADIEPLFARVRSTGQPFTAEVMPFDLLRNGFIEETFFQFCYSPILEGDEVGGVLDISVETTREVVAERRLNQIAKLASAMVAARDITEVSASAVAAIGGEADVAAAELRLWARGQLVPVATSEALGHHGIRDEDFVGVSGSDAVVLDAGWRTGMPAHHVAVGVGSGESSGVLVLELNPLRAFDVSHRSFVELLGRTVGAALENAFRRSVELGEQRLISDTLQAAMLAPASDLPTVAARYRPAAGQLSVGGDWYDVISLPDGRRALVVGDCVGHGLHAATAMGQLRSASRALLLEGRSPVEVVEAMDRFAGSVSGGDCATMACAVIDLEAGTATYACAGHLPPLLVQDGTGVWLEGGRGAPLAVLSEPRTEAVADIAPGDLLVLYSDGLVERRNEVIDVGLERLKAAAQDHAGQAVQTVADALIADLLEPRPQDDVVLLVKRVH
ncbi:MAG: SpoIIE family protein phosphatase [Aquihabitans sp.]